MSYFFFSTIFAALRYSFFSNLHEVNMKVYAGIILYATSNRKVYLLLGRERSGDGYSDFGGRIEPRETVAEAAARESFEELFPLFIGKLSASRLASSRQILDTNKSRHYLVKIPYDPSLPKLFSTEQKKFLNLPKNLLEKDRLKWFDIRKIPVVSLRPEFRDIVLQIRKKFFS